MQTSEKGVFDHFDTRNAIAEEDGQRNTDGLWYRYPAAHMKVM
jgi:hypothetical protein